MLKSMVQMHKARFSTSKTVDLDAMSNYLRSDFIRLFLSTRLTRIHATALWNYMGIWSLPWSVQSSTVREAPYRSGDLFEMRLVIGEAVVSLLYQRRKGLTVFSSRTRNAFIVST